MIEVPFLYTVLHAFHAAINLDERNYIEKYDLFKYRDKVLEKVLEDYNDNTDSMYRDEFDFDGEIEFEEINYEEELNDMLVKYNDLFYLENNKIYTNMSLEKIWSMIKEFELPHYRFQRANEKKEVLNSLGFYKIFEDAKKIREISFDLEKQIEKEYIVNTSVDKLKLLLYKRFLFILNVCTNNQSFIKNYALIDYIDDESKVIDENFDYYNDSRYIENDESYPIDNDLYENSEFYEDILDTLNPIQQNIEDFYQYAIFGEQPLYEEKYFSIFNRLYMSSNFKIPNRDIEAASQPEIENLDDSQNNPMIGSLNFDIDDEEFVFYITYIKRLNDLISEGRNDLIRIRNRLLYLLDDIKYCLFFKENFDKYYEKATKYELDEYSFEFFEAEAKYFIQDVFEGNAGKTIEKLLFTSTYYQITKDEEIIEILEDYKNDERYKKYCEIILGKTKGYEKSKIK